MLKNVVANFLEESAKKIRKDECGLDDKEIQYLASQIIHIKINKTETANILGISTKTLERRVNSGEIPPGNKDIGSNNLYWYKDEILKLL